jgi:hypothetical protein
VERVTQMLPPEDRPPARSSAQTTGDVWYFGFIGAIGVVILVSQAFMILNGRDDVVVGIIGAAVVAIWLYANTQDVTKWQANPGPTDRKV